MFGSSSQDRSEVPYSIKVCEIGKNGIVSNFERRSLFLPVKACVPSPNEDFRLFSILQDFSHLWVGPYQVIWLVLDGKHYEACTSPIAYPISPDTQGHSSGISGMWFSSIDILTEPFATLTRFEEERVVKMEQIFDDSPQSAPSYICNEETMSPYIETRYMKEGPIVFLFLNSEDYTSRKAELHVKRISCWMRISLLPTLP